MKRVAVPRVIPCLLLKNQGFVKTQQFKDPKYLGDPLNILKIFNEKEVDEIVVLDISATPAGKGPNLKLLTQMASECFMPMGYGGGVTSLRDADEVLSLGFEKVCINTALLAKEGLVREIARKFGSQSVVASIDVRKKLFGRYEAYAHCGSRATGSTPVDLARAMEDAGAGEILLNSIDRDGTMTGYDIDLIRSVSERVSIPVIACGGAGKVQDLVDGIELGGASAVAAGAFFVFQGRHRAVLINVPTPRELREAFSP